VGVDALTIVRPGSATSTHPVPSSVGTSAAAGMAEQPTRHRASNRLASSVKAFFIEVLEFERSGRHWIVQGMASVSNDIKLAIGDALRPAPRSGKHLMRHAP
jgi:hypothetical protein